MSRLVLKGHATRGKEVINLLEMLGANRLGYKDTLVGFYYYIECEAICSSDEYPTHSTIFTLEEFEEKYPYKVGDNVTHLVGKLLETHKIIWMRWDSDKCRILYYLDNCDVIDVEDILYSIKYKTEQSNPKEEITFPPYMDYDITITNKEAEKHMIKIPEIPQSINLTQSNVNEIEVVLGDYEFVLKDGKTYFVKKKPQYPKTYEECCKIVNASIFVSLVYDITDGEGYSHDVDNLKIYDNIRRLKICRDAYWKIAGEEMGLDKPWEPDWEESDGGYRYCIINRSNKIVLSREYLGENYILSFPTAEMRDMFYENFKDLIEQCKELL